MRKWTSGFILGFASFLLVLFVHNQKTSAAVNEEDLHSVLNGLILQMQVNQTSKPQYGDQNVTNELIDPSSGKLLWTQTDISLPGRDGLDFNLGVMYDSNYSFAYNYNSNSSFGTLEKYNYLISRYDLGLGWSFTLPSFQTRNGYFFYHRGNGEIYRVNLGAFPGLVGYPKLDQVFYMDTDYVGQYNNGQIRSYYYLEYKDGKREYFSQDGYIIGIVDRYGNAINFTYTDRLLYSGETNKVLSVITDTLGRTIRFAYESNLQNGGLSERITVTVHLPDGTEKQRVVYTKGRVDLTFNGNPDGYASYLSSIHNQNNESTSFNYKSEVAYLDPYGWGSNYLSWRSYTLLNKVTYPSSITNYTYEKVVRSLGIPTEEFRVTSRSDQVKVNGGPSGDYNHTNYSYVRDYTGYGQSYDQYNPYTYETISTVQSSSPTNGLTTRNFYNGWGQNTQTEIRAANGEKQIINRSFSNYESHRTLPTVTEIKTYSSDNDTSPDILLHETQYNLWWGIASETELLTPSQFYDATTKSKYTTTYTYDPTYYQLQTRSWYQNVNTPVSETYDYYANGRLKSYKNPKNEVTSYCYDVITSSNSTVSNCSNPNAALNGKVTKVKSSKAVGNGQTTVVETLYNSATNYAYPSETKSTFTTRNTAGQTVTQTVRKQMTYHIGTGLLASEKDGNGNTTSYTYDSLGRVTKVTYPAFTNISGVTYEVSDEYTYTNTSVPTTALAENARVHALLVNFQRRYINKLNNANVLLSSQRMYYDGLGFLRYAQETNNGIAQISQYRPDDLTRAVYAIDPLNNPTTVSYDAWGNQNRGTDTYGNLYVTERNLKGRKTTNYMVPAANVAAYNANPHQASLKTNYVEQEHDQWGQVLTTRAYKDWPNQSQPVTELYGYDIAGNVVTYTDPKRNLNDENVTTKYTYDTLNQLVQVKDALGQLTNYQYDGNGQMTHITVQANASAAPQTLKTKTFNETGLISTKRDAAQYEETYAYNNLGQLLQRIDRNGTVFTHQYDTQGRNTIATATGGGITEQSRLNVGSNGILYDTQEFYKNGSKMASLTIGIDYLKRITSLQVQNGNSSFTSYLGLTYDQNNRITRTNTGATTSGGFYVNYKYARLRLDKVQIDGLSAVNNADAANVKYSYNDNGTIQWVIYPKNEDGSFNLLTYYVYDAFNRITTVSNLKDTTTLSTFSYEYDNNGNIVKVTQKMGNQAPQTSTYTYDKLNRLATISRSNGTSATYTYDVQGNRLTLSDTGNVPFNVEDTSYTYDLSNRLTSVTKGATTTSFEYAPDGLRYKKTSGTTVKQYRYNASGEVIAEVNGSNQTTANYVRGDRLLMKKDVATGKSYYYLYNGHGDVVQITDSSGNIVNSYTYDEWGNITQQTEGIPNSFKYAGEIYDEETGLYYLRARYYDPSMGRFIHEDPYEGQITNPLSLNPYTYVHNNPLINVDPTGLYCVSSDGNWSHAGACSSSSNTKNYMSDVLLDMMPYIVNGKMLGHYENGSLIKYKSSEVTKQTFWDFMSEKDYRQYQLYAPISDSEFMVNSQTNILPSTVSVGRTKANTTQQYVGCNCFTAGTKVLTDEGEKNIEEIEVGDKVLAKDDETGEMAYKEVEWLFQRDVEETYNITVGGEVITTTDEHPFWIFGNGWVEAQHLAVGDVLTTSDGKELAIEKIEVKKEHATVYNFMVKDFHTYFVSNLGIWTHNACKPINLPSYRSIDIDMDHIISGHTKGGSRATQSKIKDLFPDNMNSSQIEKAVRDAYKNSSKLQTQGDRVLVSGQSNGLTIEMWVNTNTKMIETAYPVFK